MHLTAPSNWSRSIGTGGRDPSERVVTIAGMRIERVIAKGRRPHPTNGRCLLRDVAQGYPVRNPRLKIPISQSNNVAVSWYNVSIVQSFAQIRNI